MAKKKVAKRKPGAETVGPTADADAPPKANVPKAPKKPDNRPDQDCVRCGAQVAYNELNRGYLCTCGQFKRG